ncbi:dynein regulatory complex subunit 5 [Ctenodactylus gundi]
MGLAGSGEERGPVIVEDRLWGQEASGIAASPQPWRGRNGAVLWAQGPGAPWRKWPLCPADGPPAPSLPEASHLRPSEGPLLRDSAIHASFRDRGREGALEPQTGHQLLPPHPPPLHTPGPGPAPSDASVPNVPNFRRFRQRPQPAAAAAASPPPTQEKRGLAEDPRPPRALQVTSAQPAKRPVDFPHTADPSMQDTPTSSTPAVPRPAASSARLSSPGPASKPSPAPSLRQGPGQRPSKLSPVPNNVPLQPKVSKLRRMRRIIAEDAEWSLAIVPLLSELCLRHIVQNFANNPILKQLPPQCQEKVLSQLSPDLPLAVTAHLIEDEGYWRRCCRQRWPVHDVDQHGGSWKRMFFERHLRDVLSHFIPGTTDPGVVADLLPLCRSHVRALRVDQFLPPVRLPPVPHAGDQSDSGSEGEAEEPSTDHYALGQLAASLSHLEELDLAYGVKDCGMNFEWSLFLFTYRDCHSLAACLKACHTLKTFRLTRSRLDDEKARILISSLLDHPALEELDLSHNLIGDQGARGAAKLLNHSHLRVLNLANNQIRAAGAQSLAHALARNATLLSLDLRLNCIEDEGGQALAHALEANECLTTLHLGGNQLSEPTATLLAQVLPINTTLTSISLSCNQIGPVSGGERRAGRVPASDPGPPCKMTFPFSPHPGLPKDGGKQLLEGMVENKTLLDFDLRLSEVAQESEYLISQALQANREAARQQAANHGHLAINSSGNSSG